MSARTPAESARFRADAHAYAAEVFRSSPSQAQRNFAPTLDEWAARARDRAERAEAGEQKDLFS